MYPTATASSRASSGNAVRRRTDADRPDSPTDGSSDEDPPPVAPLHELWLPPHSVFPARVQRFRAWLSDVWSDPDSSRAANYLSILVLLTIVVSILSFVLQTMPELKKGNMEIPEEVWDVIEIFSSVLFSIEYVCRLITCNVYKGSSSVQVFVLTPLNMCDLMAIVPFYVDLIIKSSGSESSGNTGALKVLRAVRLVRLFRIFKLGRYSSGMQLMAEAVGNSFQALWVLVFFLCIGIVLFSSALFFAEKMSCPANPTAHYNASCADGGDGKGWSTALVNDFNGVLEHPQLCCDEYSAPNDFPSIVSTFWWSIVTMTTVGFGDVYPRTWQGRIVGACSMLCGILLIALPVAIVGSKFQEAYNNEEARRVANLESRTTSRVAPVSAVSAEEILDKGPHLQAEMEDQVSFCRRLMGIVDGYDLATPVVKQQVSGMCELLEQSNKIQDRIKRLRKREATLKESLQREFEATVAELAEMSAVGD